MRKFQFISSLSKLSFDFGELARREISGEEAKICQTYVQLRNLHQEWTLAIVSSNRLRKTRIVSTSKIIIFSLIENVDLFIEERLKNISKITDLNSLDKDSLKNLSKLIFERNSFVSSEILNDVIPQISFYSVWDQKRISNVLSEEISVIVANALRRVFQDEGAEKDWNLVWKELILYRDLAIVLFYSRAKLENEKSQCEKNIAAQVKVWSSQFVDILMGKVEILMTENDVTISVFRQNSNLPKELVNLVSNLSISTVIKQRIREFHKLFSQLTASIIKDSFLASSTTTSKICMLLDLCEELVKSNIEHMALLNSTLFMVSLLIQRINHFFENGCLTPFFKLLYGEFDVVIKRIEALWPTLEEAHNKAEMNRSVYPGQLEYFTLSMEYVSSLQQELTNVRNINIIKYCDWVKETIHEIMDQPGSFPRAKYWRSTQPKHIELSSEIIKEIVIPINQSISEFEVEIQFEIMQLAATQICEIILKYIKVTDYRYSTQAAEKLRSECFAIHDALRDPEVLNEKVVDRLGRLDIFGKIFTVCQILCVPIGGLNQAKNTIRPSAGLADLDSKIEKYELEKSDWTRLKQKPSKLNRILLCKE